MAEPAPMILRMATRSMHPTICAGDLVLARPDGASPPRKGEVWILRPDPAADPQAHRIVRVLRRDGQVWIVTRGDGNAQDDGLLPRSIAVARVMAVGRELGRRPSGLAWALAAPARRWLLSGWASRLDSALRWGHAALAGRGGGAARRARRALIAAFLAHEELLAAARAHALVEIAGAASRRS